METPIKSAQYQHLSSIERVQIMLFQRQGLSMNAIACELKRAASTISRELRRSPLRGDLPYECGHASAQSRANHHRSRNPCKLKLGGALFARVTTDLRAGWSPLQIAGRLRSMHPDEPSVMRFVWKRKLEICLLVYLQT